MGIRALPRVRRRDGFFGGSREAMRRVRRSGCSMTSLALFDPRRAYVLPFVRRKPAVGLVEVIRLAPPASCAPIYMGQSVGFAGWDLVRVQLSLGASDILIHQVRVRCSDANPDAGGLLIGPMDGRRIHELPNFGPGFGHHDQGQHLELHVEARRATDVLGAVIVRVDEGDRFDDAELVRVRCPICRYRISRRGAA